MIAREIAVIAFSVTQLNENKKIVDLNSYLHTAYKLQHNLTYEHENL